MNFQLFSLFPSKRTLSAPGYILTSLLTDTPPGGRLSRTADTSFPPRERTASKKAPRTEPVFTVTPPYSRVVCVLFGPCSLWITDAK